tara:strand:+ start:1329 stop:1520 length:192 start_codon:yes stop_codon:yes gene_type:complete
MSAIKNYMWDVGEFAADHGIAAARDKYFESEEGVKLCIMFTFAYDGSWEQFISEGNWKEPPVH